MRLLLHTFSDDLRYLLLSKWLDVHSLVTLDVAVSSMALRPYWTMLLQFIRSDSIDSMDHCASSLMWLIKRGICTSRIQMKANAWRVPAVDLILRHCCSKLTIQTIQADDAYIGVKKFKIVFTHFLSDGFSFLK